MNLTETLRPKIRGTIDDADRLRLAWVLAKYDHGALPDGVAAMVKKVQADIAWNEHEESQS